LLTRVVPYIVVTLLQQLTNMRFTPFIVAAATALRVVQADFMVYTEPPIPIDSMPQLTDPAEVGSPASFITHPPADYIKASGWSLSVSIAANSAYKSLTKELGATYRSSRSSAASEIEAFVHSAHNYSIPKEVTDFHTTTTFFSKPDWYDALPTAARAFKELQVVDQFSIVKSIVDAAATEASSKASSMASSIASSLASSTGAAAPTAQAFLDAKFGAMAAVAAAVFL
jgi:hypothetical protein